MWNKHPAPQMKRESWYSLNGRWILNGKAINVPYPPQSELSGYLGETKDHLTYEKIFEVPDDFGKCRILLHFGAVDQIAEVWLNDQLVGRHEGGYLPFSFDITEAVHRIGKNSLRVEVTDTLDTRYPYGKQCKKRGGMWYTPVSGIWQSVWLENVPDQYIKSVRFTPDLQGVDVEVEGVEEFKVCVVLPDGEKKNMFFQGGNGRIQMDSPKLWTPDDPVLYPVVIAAGEDKVESYFALRTITIEDKQGIQRVCLNEEPIFLHGVLDQGYFQDGIYLPEEEEEYERDILRMKELGYNLLRKHIKVEPPCFYEACDRLGMLVMQDMVNNGSYHYIRDTVLPTLGMKKKCDNRKNINGQKQQIFIKHTEETIHHLYNYPCIVAYTIFNEGWGQFHSDQLFRMVKKWDSTRLVDSTSGWFAQNENDFDSEHIYFRVKTLTPGNRPLFVTECGGYALKIEKHCYNPNKQYGYGTCRNSGELTDRIEHMYRVMILSGIPAGICGCIYTQLSDVEDEINGLYTYDRKVCKVEKERMRLLSEEMKEAVQKGN
ncbi:MAG: glycoside hydrolase family 2 [Lachnospiraceae bacterium]|nr:glycoside hydrolase family 2 [Lachnospiraceae bacterium]